MNSPTVSLRLLVVVPCLNEGATIGAVLSQIPSEISGIGEIVKLVIDDGSTDDTRAASLRTGALVLSHPKNYGVGASFQTGLKYAIDHCFDIMVNLDGDGQFNPADIPKLVTPITSGAYDFVTASRFSQADLMPNIPPVKLWGNRQVSNIVNQLTGQTFKDVSCGFRAYSKEALLHLNLHGRFTYCHESFISLCFKGLRMLEVPIQVRYFDGRVSRVARSLPKYALNALLIMGRTYRDYKPLRFFWAVALLLLFPAAILAAIFFLHYYRTGYFMGYLWAGLTSAFLGGVSILFFVLGILADGLGTLRANQERQLYWLKKLHMERD